MVNAEKHEAKSVKSTALSKAEMMGLRPLDRERYIEKLLLEVMDNGKYWTVREIVESTTLSRPTVMRHIQKLQSNRQIVAEERLLGAMRITFYRGLGKIQNKTQSQSKFSGNQNYVFFTLDSGEESSICVQQREKDEFGLENVKGAIAINYDDFQQFIKELNTFGAKVIQK